MIPGWEHGKSLPVHEVTDALFDALQHHSTVILEAPPGAGKSTWVPLFLANKMGLDSGRILMLEPRRLAARAVAHRMAWMAGSILGEEIGYSIRFDQKVSERTRIEVITEGILPGRLLKDPELTGVNLVILDEFHERSIMGDEGLALLLECRTLFRPDLKILIMSATLDSLHISEKMNQAPIIKSDGRMFPVDLLYHPPEPSQTMEEAMAELIRKAWAEQKSPTLVFLPGVAEIERTTRILEGKLSGVTIYSLYGELPWDQQQEILTDTRNNRIILSTSIAETSLTLPGIKTVVDSGYSRISVMHPSSGMSRLETIRVSKDTADQRAGRAGRLGPGVCYRNWSRLTQDHLLPHRTPEILQADLAPLILDLAQWDQPNPEVYFWLDAPPTPMVNYARQMLEQLGALQNQRITDFGKRLGKWPLHPRLAAMMEKANEWLCLAVAADIAALLENKDFLQQEVQSADIGLRLEWLSHNRQNPRIKSILPVIQQLKKIAGKFLENEYQVEKAGILLYHAFPDQVAKKTENPFEYKMANGQKVICEPYDPLHRSEWIVVARYTSGKTARVRMAAEIQPQHIKEHQSETHRIFWDSRENRIVALTEKKWGGLVAQTQIWTTPTNEEIYIVQILAIRQTGMTLFAPDEDFRKWQNKVQLWNRFFQDRPLPNCQDEALISEVTDWFPIGQNQIRTSRQFETCSWKLWIKQRLTWEQNEELERTFPSHFVVPTGSKIPIQYPADNGQPILSVRLQEIFGMPETPIIANGRITLLIELLSPAYRPVQITGDLKSFWNNTYHQVKKELKGRYPKHAWPDDPWTAPAIKGVVKKKK